MKDKRNNWKSKKGMIIMGVMICVVVFIGVLYGGRVSNNDKIEVGTKTKETKEQIEKRKEHKVDESVLAVGMEQVIKFSDKESEGLLNIENMPENTYDMEVVITNDQKEVVYESERMKPGTIIRKDTLKKEMKKGNHLCTATFKAFNKDGKEVKAASAQIEIQIKK